MRRAGALLSRRSGALRPAPGCRRSRPRRIVAYPPAPRPEESPLPLDPNALFKTRPYLYHLTARLNLPRIRRTRVLDPANRLLKLAGQALLGSERRRGPLRVDIDGEAVELRDQDPLHEGNIALGGAWSLADLVHELNSRVFFWPGRETGPIDYGLRHFARYESEQPVLLRCRTADLLAADHPDSIELCRFNSGSPRCSGGRKSPRGPETFLPLDRFDHPPGRVVEVTVRGQVRLPADTWVGRGPAGPWELLRGAEAGH